MTFREFPFYKNFQGKSPSSAQLTIEDLIAKRVQGITSVKRLIPRLINEDISPTSTGVRDLVIKLLVISARTCGFELRGRFERCPHGVVRPTG